MAFGQKQHFHIATDGLRSCNPCVVATMGMLGFQVEVTTEKVKYSPYRKPQTVDWQDYNDIVGDKYLIKITVTYKNRKWSIERLISEPLFDRIRVVAEFLRMEKLTASVTAVYRGLLNNIKVFAKRIG